ncbi:hypothetical protein [Streptomyces sp. MB09-02B]|uniref:hypothetical protein n=1 Tax=Streptomyces sp. MB09-02B TaxID=3028667 RepID=UPI0029BC592F|nr:hypothetical protein [Streptomyces sp. MB09-02B]MDX3643941.1 hypothetical protein [Streptomyces sp. MB09-02B]
MNHASLWADSVGAAARSTIADQETLLVGRTDLDDRGIERLWISPGRISGIVTARNSGAELRVAITLPVLTADQASNVRTASPHCEHHDAEDNTLPDCLADPAHAGGVTVVPSPGELRFICTCAMTTPCRHAAALAHALTDRLATHPEDFAVLRGLRQPQHPAQDLPTAGAPTDTRPKNRLSAHHAWAWYRQYPDLPPVPEYSPSLSEEPPGLPDWAPPPPAPTTEHLHALVNDAAAQARDFLRTGIPLQCAWDADAVRLSSRIPHTCIPDIADRLGLDVADLRNRITECHTNTI